MLICFITPTHNFVIPRTLLLMNLLNISPYGYKLGNTLFPILLVIECTCTQPLNTHNLIEAIKIFIFYSKCMYCTRCNTHKVSLLIQLNILERMVGWMGRVIQSMRKKRMVHCKMCMLYPVLRK